MQMLFKFVSEVNKPLKTTKTPQKSYLKYLVYKTIHIHSHEMLN